MKEKEEIKEGKKFSLLDGLVLLSGIFAAVVIVYTAYWYVDINEKDEEVVVSEMEELYVCKYDKKDFLGHTIIKNINIKGVERSHARCELYGCEPKKIVKKKVITSDGDCNTYRQLYYSTELEAKTAFTYYEEDFENVNVDGNVITFLCK